MNLSIPTDKFVKPGGYEMRIRSVADFKNLIDRYGQGFGVNKHPDPKFYPSLGLIAHNGVDIPLRERTGIYAAHSGIVLTVDEDFLSGFGIRILGEGYKTIYWHNRQNLVKAGQKVKRGELIAKADSTGYSTGHHLHFGLKLLDQNGEVQNRGNGFDGAVDPMKYFKDTANYLRNMDREFINDQYIFFLGRPGNSEELIFWEGKSYRELQQALLSDRAKLYSIPNLNI